MTEKAPFKWLELLKDKMCHNIPLNSLQSIFVAHQAKNLWCTEMKRQANSVTN